MVKAIAAAGTRGVAVAIVQWSEVPGSTLAIDWTLLRTRDDATAFARKITRIPRLLPGGHTGIGRAVLYSLRQIQINRFEGRRKIIDISSDGRNNDGPYPSTARDETVAKGVTVNGLAILTDHRNLTDYFRERVVGGPGAFVVSAADYGDFGLAMEEKLAREISGKTGN